MVDHNRSMTIAKVSARALASANNWTRVLEMTIGRWWRRVFITLGAAPSRTFYRRGGRRWSKTERKNTCRSERQTAGARSPRTGRPVRRDRTVRSGSGRANAGGTVDPSGGALTNALPTCVLCRPSGRRESSRTFDSRPLYTEWHGDRRASLSVTGVLFHDILPCFVSTFDYINR